MNLKEAIQSQMKLADFLVTSYLSDLSDEEWLKRPGGKANHIKWQMGHLISSEQRMMSFVKEGASPALPEGFSEKHTKETSASDSAEDFLSKDEYLELYAKQREATYAILEGLSEDEFDKPGPPNMEQIAPTVAHLFSCKQGIP